MCAPRRPALLVVKPALCSRPVGQAVSSIHAHGMTKPAPSVAAPQPRANGICCASSASATPYAGFTSGIASALHVLSKRAVQLQAERRSLPQQDEGSAPADATPAHSTAPRACGGCGCKGSGACAAAAAGCCGRSCGSPAAVQEP